MDIYGIKFKRKGESQVISALFTAQSMTSFRKKLAKYLKTKDGQDIDKRTITWSGDTIPLGRTDGPVMIYQDLDGLT